MSMTTELKLAQRMKAVALEATKGPWISFDDDWSDGENAVITNEARDNTCTSPVALVEWGGSESCDTSPFYAEQRANAEHIATSCPENVVALAEALEAALKRNAELEESHALVIQSRDHYKLMSEEGLIKLREARALTVTPPKQKPTDPYSVVPAKNLMAIGYNKALVDYAIVLCRAGISVEKE
ncbi:TPA: hypothetical protein ACP4PI_000303 [Escherichia coli]